LLCQIVILALEHPTGSRQCGFIRSDIVFLDRAKAHVTERFLGFKIGVNDRQW
jgi:hypothetical protein